MLDSWLTSLGVLRREPRGQPLPWGIGRASAVHRTRYDTEPNRSCPTGGKLADRSARGGTQRDLREGAEKWGNGGGVHHGAHEQALGSDQHMALATIDSLPTLITSGTTHDGRFHRLAGDDYCHRYNLGSPALLVKRDRGVYDSSTGWYLLSASHDGGYPCRSTRYVPIPPPGASL
jgi:hypothetical protein